MARENAIHSAGYSEHFQVAKRARPNLHTRVANHSAECGYLASHTIKQDPYPQVISC